MAVNNWHRMPTEQLKSAANSNNPEVAKAANREIKRRAKADRLFVNKWDYFGSAHKGDK